MIISYHSNHGHIISSPTNAEPLKWRQAGLAAQIIVANQNADLHVRSSIIDDKNTKFRALITLNYI